MPSPVLHQRARDPVLRNRKLAAAARVEEPVRLEMTARLNQLLADTMTLRDLWGLLQKGVVGLPIAYSVRPFAKGK